MTEQNWNLADAIKLAMEAEQKAAAVYRGAVDQTANPLAKRLFGKLAEFETYHYTKLVELDASLRAKGAFIEYTGQTMPIPAQGEVEGLPEANKMSMMKIVAMAQQIELQAQHKYEDLAERTADPAGKAMFQQLAQEEQGHYRLLRDVYWNLNDSSSWSWPQAQK